jgi:hypothetical protein
MESELQMLSRHDAHLPPLYNVLLLGDEARQGDSSPWFSLQSVSERSDQFTGVYLQREHGVCPEVCQS